MDKNKIIQNAQKFIQKGQIDKAIKEYSKIVEADPKDVRTRLKIGDLHAKKGANREAADTYMKVAEAYGQQGFFLKAVAVYKQILKLQPDLIDVNLKLAELYHQLGLMSDAMAQYQTVVGYYEAAGDMRSSFATLKKMLDLDPDNVASRIKLAEMYSKENMVVEAVDEFRAAAAWLKERNRIDDYVKVLERLVYHQPEDLALTRELANIYLAKGDTKRSLAKLQICFKADPRDVETLHLLGQAFLDLGQTSKTVSVYKELAKIHGDAGRLEEKRAAWKKVLEVAPDDPDAQAALASRPEAARPAPAGPPPGVAAPAAGRPPGAQAPAPGRPPGAAAPAAAPAAPAPSSAEAVAKLLTETDVYLKYGLHDKALEHLKKVFAIAPTNLEAHEKAKDLFIAAGNTEAAGQELVTLVQLTVDADPERARGYLKELMGTAPHLPEVRGFVEKLGAPEVEQISFLESGPTDLNAADDEEVLIADADDEILIADDGDGFTEEVVAGDDEVFGVDMAQGAAEDDGVFEIDDGLDVDVAADDFASGDDDASEDDDAFVIDDELLAGGDLDDAMAEAAAAVGDAAEEDDDFDSPTEMIAAEDVPDLADAALEDEATAHGIPDLDTDFVSVAGEEVAGPDLDLDAPEDTGLGLVVVEDDAPAEPELTMPGMEAEAADAAPAAKSDDEVADELEEAEFFLQQGLPDEAREVVLNVLAALPDHAHAQALLAQIDAGGDEDDAVEVADIDDPETAVGEPMVATDEPTELGEVTAPAAADAGDAAPAEADDGAESFDDFDLAGELADELAELEGETAGNSPLQEFQVSADDVFAEFKKGVAKAVSSEDADTHYDLGIAYREMGLTADAIGEFQLAAKQPGKRIDSLSMIGQCHRELGDLDAAIAAYGDALETEDLPPEAAKALHYDLGTAHAEKGEASAAARHFKQTLAIDPKFRDAKSRLEALGDVSDDDLPAAPVQNGVAGVSPDEGGSAARPSKTGKVGYL
jgi:pilus assembly protein FimV